MFRVFIIWIFYYCCVSLTVSSFLRSGIMNDRITPVRCECQKCVDPPFKAIDEVFEYFKYISDELKENQKAKIKICKVLLDNGKILQNVTLEFNEKLEIDGYEFLKTSDGDLFNLTEYENLFIVEANEEIKAPLKVS